MRMLAMGLGIASAAVLAAPAAAQGGHGGVAGSGMDQGQARISSRSDVRLSMESMPGTSGAAMGTLGQRVGARMAQIRGCYERRVGEDPRVTGTLRLRLLLEGNGAPRVEVDRDGVGDASVLQCIRTALGAIDTAQLTRPTRAVVVLELTNTASQGAERAAERAQETPALRLSTDAQGNPTATGGTANGHVRFTVTGRGAGAAPAVTNAHRALDSALPGLMDCRRRAGRRGRTPGGDLSATMEIHVGRAPASRVTSSTVPNDRTRPCVTQALGRIELRPTEGSGSVDVQIHFEPADEVSGARD